MVIVQKVKNMKHIVITTIIVIALLGDVDVHGQKVYKTSDNKIVVDGSAEKKMPQGAVTTTKKYTAATAATNDAFVLGSREAADVANSKLYFKFEIAPHDMLANGSIGAVGSKMSWADGYNRCKALSYDGGGWRLATQRELMLIFIFKPALDVLFPTVSGTTLGSVDYWSTTEISETVAYWIYNIGNFTGRKNTDNLVRCIREMPTPTILEYGVAPFSQTGDVSYGSTQNSYNGLYGEGQATNGAYRTTDVLAYQNEKPYYKFEVAKFDAYDGSVETKTWRMLQGTAANKSDNICVQTHGEGWRIPRISEMKLIHLNRAALNASGDGFTPLPSSALYWWSTTQYASGYVWLVRHDNGDILKGQLSHSADHISVRCIREIP